MNSNMVFAKTEKGHEEIEKRTNHIDFKHRTALIVVDGKSTVGTLLGKIPNEGVRLLEELLRDGYIVSADGQIAETTDEPAIEDLKVDAANFDLEAAKRNSVRVIEAVLGPGGESLAVAIERSKTKEEFGVQAQRTSDIISQMGGPRKAAEFWAQTGL